MTISKPGFFGPLPFTADQLITHSNKSNTSFPPSNISPPVNRLVTLTDPGTDSNIASPSSGSFSLALTLFLTLSHSCAHIPTPTLIRACTLLHACTTAHTHTVLTPRDRCCKVSKKGYRPRTTPTPPKKKFKLKHPLLVNYISAPKSRIQPRTASSSISSVSPFKTSGYYRPCLNGYPNRLPSLSLSQTPQPSKSSRTGGPLALSPSPSAPLMLPLTPYRSPRRKSKGEKFWLPIRNRCCGDRPPNGFPSEL